MSITYIKTIALLCMLLDHIAVVFGFSGLNVISSDVLLLRQIGRIAFPLFAFSVANGFRHTKNKENYIFRIFLFAGISQIPFTMAFHPVNLLNLPSDINKFRFFPFYTYWLSIFLLLMLYIFFRKTTKFSNKKCIVILFTCLLSILYLNTNGFWFLSDQLNVFYTFANAILFIYLCQVANEKKTKWYQITLMFMILISFSLFIGIRADYGKYLCGVLLILLLYITHKHRLFQCFVIIIWGTIVYGVIYQNNMNILFVAISALIILFYNDKIIPKKAYWFYILYPLHLLLFSLPLLLRWMSKLQ